MLSCLVLLTGTVAAAPFFKLAWRRWCAGD